MGAMTHINEKYQETVSPQKCWGEHALMSFSLNMSHKMQYDKLRRRRLTKIELAFLLELAQGPRMMTEGPLGRCLKRGWCKQVEPSDHMSTAAFDTAVYAITEGGLDVIALARSGEIRVLKR
jgi:hypothetical protein